MNDDQIDIDHEDTPGPSFHDDLPPTQATSQHSKQQASDDDAIIITMTNGNVIEADHVVDMGTYVLVGIEPAAIPILSPGYYHNTHHDFWRPISQVIGRYPDGRAKSAKRLRLWRTILTINKVNITSIE